MENEKFDMMDFVPSEIYSGKNGNKYLLEVKEWNQYLMISYKVPQSKWKGLTGNGYRVYDDSIKRYINKNNDTFEVLGLLQAEMGKTQNGCLNFCNHEYQIMNKVMLWFEKEFEILQTWWKWYIKININEPNDSQYKKEIETKVVNYWLEKTNINSDMAYPKKVSYIKNTTNKKLGFYDYGTLIIESKKNILSQVVKKFVKDITYEHILNSERSYLQNYMRGIIAGESNVEIDKKSKKFRVFITAKEDCERDIFENCLKCLGISGNQYGKALVISKKANMIEMLKQKLLCSSNKKYNKFLIGFNIFDNFPEYEEWKSRQIVPHNKIPQQTINQIIELHKLNPNHPAWKIAEQVGVSAIKVQRVRKELATN